MPDRELVKPSAKIGASELDLHLDFPIRYANRVAADLDARVVRPGAVGQPKSPGVPGAGDNSLLHIALAQGVPHVRTSVVDSKVIYFVAENSDQLVRHLDHARLALHQFADPKHRMKVRHNQSQPNLKF